MRGISCSMNKLYNLPFLLVLVGAASGCALDRGGGQGTTGDEAIACPVALDGVMGNQIVCPPSTCGDGICGSGESQFSCPDDCLPPPPPPPYTWSAWLNRDLPSGTGDWEDLPDFSAFQVGCALPAQINAKTISGTSWQSTGEVLQVSPDVGLICRNADQPDGVCEDYQVQFGCATATNLNWAALTQSWHENVSLITGNIHDFVPLATAVPSAHFVQTMTFSSDGSFSITNPGPTDAPYTSAGTWTRSGAVITVNYFDRLNNFNVQEIYQVAEITSSVFRFRRL
jgi:hypothetical protein